MLQLLSQTHGVTDDLSPWLLVAGAAVVALLVLVLISPRLRGTSQKDERISRSPGEPTLAQQRAVERDMQTLVHELSEMTRKVGAQLDARAARLEQLIREADERLRELRCASAPAASNGHPEATPPASAMPETRDQEIVDPRHAQIYTLMDEGLTPHQIADRLNRPEGEVELIMALRPRGRGGLSPSPSGRGSSAFPPSPSGRGSG